jgi:hypothetical protein
MPNIRGAQDLLGRYFDLGGTDRPADVKLGAVEQVIFDAANQFLNLAKQRIQQRKKVDKGNLADLEVFPLQEKSNSLILTIGYRKENPASVYYDFQNKGVRGIQSKKPDSPYSFKTLTVSNNMVKAIMEWYLRHKNYIKNEDQRTGLTGLQIRRRNLGTVANPQKKLRDVAKKTAENIKKRGIPKVGFFEDNVDKAFGKDFTQKLAKALGQSVALTIKYSINNGNNNR